MFSLIKKLGISADAMNAAAESNVDSGGDDAEGSASSAELPELDGAVPEYMLDEQGRLRRFVNGAESDADPAELADGSPKRTYDLKGMMTALGCPVNGVVFDTTLAAYLLNVSASEYTVERLCAEYSVPAGSSGGETIHRLNCALAARVTAQGMDMILKDIEIPLAQVLVSMERDGIAVDRNALVRSRYTCWRVSLST